METYLATGELGLAKHDYALAAEAFREAVKRRRTTRRHTSAWPGRTLPSDPEGAQEALARASSSIRITPAAC